MLQSFKNEVKVLARDNGLNLSGYIKYLLTQQLKKANKKASDSLFIWEFFMKKYFRNDFIIVW